MIIMALVCLALGYFFVGYQVYDFYANFWQEVGEMPWFMVVLFILVIGATILQGFGDD